MRGLHRRVLAFLLLSGAHFLTSFPMLLLALAACMHDHSVICLVLPVAWFFPLHLALLAEVLDDERVSDPTFLQFTFALAINSLVWAAIVYGLWLTARRAYAWWRPKPVPKPDTRVERLLREWVCVPAPERADTVTR